MKSSNVDAGLELLKAKFPADAAILDLRLEVETDLHAWLTDLGVLPEPCGAIATYALGHFAVSCYGSAADRGMLKLAARYLAALFLLDDHYCDDEQHGSVPVLLGERMTLLMAVLDPACLGPIDRVSFAAIIQADPVLRVWEDVMRDLVSRASPAQLGRMRHETINMLLSMAGEASWRMTRRLPNRWEYALNRQYNGALACTALIDVIAGYEVPAQEYYDDAIRRCSMLASNAIIVGNDYFSAAKEAKTLASTMSLSGGFFVQSGLSAAEASRQTAALYVEAVEAFQALRADLEPQVSDVARRYLDGLDLWVRGAVDWYNQTARYPQSAEAPAPRDAVSFAPESTPFPQDFLGLAHHGVLPGEVLHPSSSGQGAHGAAARSVQTGPAGRGMIDSRVQSLL